MSQPEIVSQHLDDEQAVAEVDLGGEDELYVTPTRTLIYRSEGLLSDETVEEYGHDAERIAISESRRKATIKLDYGLGGEDSFAVPKGKLNQVLHPVLAGVLNAAGITEPGETVKRTFRFSELTLVVTSARVVKHIGQAVWDEDFEEFHFDDVTDLGFEEGNVATSVVLTVNGRQERFKAPNEQARDVREAITAALLAHAGVGSLEEFRALSADEDDEEVEENVSFGDGPDPLVTGSTSRESADAAAASTATEPLSTDDDDAAAEAEADADAEMAFEPATEALADEPAESDDLAAEVAQLREAVERQTEELERQAEIIQRLIDELRQGR